MTLILDLSFWDTVLLVVFVIVVSFGAGRVLGVRRGFWRSTASGIVGTLAGLAVAATLLRGDTTATGEDVLIVAFGFAVLATMIVSVTLEAVLRPSRTGRRASLRTRVRSFLTVGGRLWEVARIARRHGLAGPRLASRAALSSADGGLRIRRFLEDCGGMFVKFGQIASTRSDLLPAPVIEALGDLQANVKAVPTPQILERLEDELSAPVADVFAEFDDEPLAAASIGQTYLARLRPTTADGVGRPVVVKVRRPGIEVGVARDSAVLRWASRTAARRSAAVRSLGLAPLAEELIRSIDGELSYLAEATSARALDVATTEPGVRIPHVLTDLSTDAVLVLQRVEGRPVSDTAAVDATGVPRAELAQRLLGTFLTQVMSAGVFHADPHPGNVLIDAEGTLWLIDFGAVGIIDPVTMESLQLMAAGLATGQPGLIVRALRPLAGPAGDTIRPQVLEAEISRVLSAQMHSGGFDPRSMQDVIAIMQHQGIPVPPTLTLLGRALVTLEGTLRTVDPQVDLATAAASQLASTLDLSPAGTQDVVRKELVRNLPSLRALPGLVEDLALQLRSGQARVQVDAFSGPGATVFSRWVDRTMFAAVAAVGLLASALMLVGAALAPDTGASGTLTAVGYIGLVVTSAMLMRVVAQILRREADPGS
ncbi:AarF/ABC1/UbiB kinase family protein [Pseudonocardia sp. N23]|uniref:ABC1 kinase family protein n=1 Tax=Pseudonocardia sp. N23 TaxID=1987376 RepID=UPI000BFE6085|nr:AarF/UbiB family protein [Pseudonocardia sp. N23]GAY09737.1 ABC1 family protein [Pseudonocardia sp. N23]